MKYAFVVFTIFITSCAQPPSQSLPKYKSNLIHQRKPAGKVAVTTREATQEEPQLQSQELAYSSAGNALDVYEPQHIVVAPTAAFETKTSTTNHAVYFYTKPFKGSVSPKMERKIVKLKERLASKNIKPQPTTDGFQSLDRNLKIGIVLIAVGLGFSILGLGAIGGLAALIGLVFLVLGLLNTY